MGIIEEINIKEAFKIGISGFISKPFTSVELLEIIQKTLKKEVTN